MTNLTNKETRFRTLANRLAEGGMPVEEALHYATLLGEALRRIHDSGTVHGAVSPETVLLTAGGIELTPAPEAQDGSPGTSADILAFGTVLCEMLTIPKVLCEGKLTDAKPFDNPALERLIAGCLSTDPSGRLPSIQKVLLELKLVTLSMRQAGVSTATRRDLDAIDAAIHASEARQDARIREHEKSVAEQQQAASDALSELRVDFAALETRLTGAQRTVEDNAGRLSALERSVNSAPAGSRRLKLGCRTICTPSRNRSWRSPRSSNPCEDPSGRPTTWSDESWKRARQKWRLFTSARKIMRCVWILWNR